MRGVDAIEAAARVNGALPIRAIGDGRPGRLPLRACAHTAGDVLDADGEHVLTVQPGGFAQDGEAQHFATLVASAINAVGAGMTAVTDTAGH